MSGSPLSRRDVLRVAGFGSVAGVVGAGVLSGCDLAPDSAPRSSDVAPPDPDQRIVDAARAELRHLLARVSPTGSTASLAACHRRQLAALQGRPATRRGRSWTTSQTVARERRAADRFTHWSLASQNGDLARVLASVAAGIRMQPLLQETAQSQSGAPS